MSSEMQAFRKHHRGFLLIAAVIIIAVAGTMAMAIATLTSGSDQGGGQHVSSTQALFAAETGLERAFYGFTKQGTACGSLAYNANLTVGGDTARYATSAVLYTPTPTTVSVAITAATTTIPVASITNYASHGRVNIGAEAINYTGTSSSAAVCGTAPCLTGATRGAAGTTAAAAAVGASVVQYQCTVTSVGTANNGQRTLDRAIFAAYTGAMVTYVHEDNDGVPYFRTWNGTAWSAEGTANTVGSEIRFMILKVARTRREYILVTQNLNGQIHAQIWNGTTWSAVRLLGTNGTAAERNRRSFDVEYESAGDRAMVVYRNNNNADPDYQFWNGSAWNAAAGTAVTVNATTGRPIWIELARNPSSTSNELVMMVIDINENIHGTRWDGTAWSNMGAAAIWDVGANSDTKHIHVVYEQGSAQRAMFVWSDTPTCTLRYRLWTPGTSTLSAIANFPAAWTGCADVATWVRMAANPFNNNIILGVQDNDNDLSTCFWNGTAWSCGPAATHPEHAIDVESGTNPSFDVVFSSDSTRSGQAWLIWGALAGGGTNIWRRLWDTTTATWSAIDIYLGPDLCLARATAHPNTGIILSAMYEDQDTGDVSVNQWIGGAWSIPQVLWDGNIADAAGNETYDCQGGTLIHERVAVAAERNAFTPFDWIEVLP